MNQPKPTFVLIMFVSLALLLISLLTNPLSDLAFVFLFFCLLGILIYQLAKLLFITTVNRGGLPAVRRRQLMMVAAGLAMAAALNAAGSLTWVEGGVLVLFVLAWCLYAAYRFGKQPS